MDSILEDIRYALRSLRRAPLFTIASLVILSVGTGVASGLFGIVHHLLVLPYDVPGHERLVLVGDRMVSRGETRGSMSVARFEAYRAIHAFDGLEALSQEDAALQSRDGSERLGAARVTPDLYRVLGVAMRAGRGLQAADAIPGAAATALVSERFVRSHLGTAPEQAPGRTIRLDGVQTTIVGVVPTAYELPIGTDVWRPLAIGAGQAVDRAGRMLTGAGRLRRGATLATARAEILAVGAAESRRFPDTDRELRPWAEPIGRGVQDEISPMFEKVSSVAVALALLVVAANLAGLQLARNAARRREWAVRAALGATPARLARQSLVECLLLSGAGGLAGLWVARLTIQVVLASIPPTVTRYIPGWSGIAVDGVLVAYVLAVTIVTGLAFGLAPALNAGRAPAALALRGGGAGALGSVHARSRAAMVVAEVALSLALLVGGALMVGGFRRMSGPDLGFDPTGVLTLKTSLRETRYPDAVARARYHTRVLERVDALPGVTAAAMISRLPSSGSTAGVPVRAEGSTVPPEQAPHASIRVVTPQVFDVLRLPLVRGRAFEARDAGDAPAVVVVNETFARRAWPGLDPLGRRLTFEDASIAAKAWTVVGVAKDVKRNWFERDVAPMAYVPDAQWGAAFMQLIVRTDRDPLALAAPVRRALAAVDPDVPVDGVMSLERHLADRTAGVRVGAAIMGWLGLFALLLAALGLYALVAFHVARRAPEFGVRMALGAGRQDILTLVLREGGRLVGVGLLVGAPLAAALCWLMTATLFGTVRPSAVTLAGILAVLVVTAGIALWIPAWRASRLDPVDALRRE